MWGMHAMRIIKLTIFAGCFSLVTPAAALERVVVDTSSGHAQGGVGTFGLPDYSERAKYELVIRPRLDTNSYSGVRNPNSIKEAVSELIYSLPKEYLNEFHSVIEYDQHNVPVVACVTNNARIDAMVNQWMIVKWGLGNSSSRLWQDYANIGDYYAESIAQDIRNRVCLALER